jgi:ribonuclease P protein component
VLPKNARLTASEDFALTIKSGSRLTTENLVGYLYIKPAINNSEPTGARSGLIVNKSVGGSVKRHRIARQIRHDIAPLVLQLPTNSLLVIRVLRQPPSFTTEVNALLTGLIARTSQVKARS